MVDNSKAHLGRERMEYAPWFKRIFSTISATFSKGVVRRQWRRSEYFELFSSYSRSHWSNLWHLSFVDSRPWNHSILSFDQARPCIGWLYRRTLRPSLHIPQQLSQSILCKVRSETATCATRTRPERFGNITLSIVKTIRNSTNAVKRQYSKL